MTDFISAAIPSLTSAQRGFQLASGETVVVEVVRAAEKPDDTAINLKVTAWQVDPATGKRIDDSGIPIQIPSSVRSVSISALADGALTLDSEIADATVQALARFRNHRAAMVAWKRVPLEEVATADVRATP